MQWYRTGTITITNGSATVTGASTLWSDVGTLMPGDILNGPDGKLYEILTINSNTGITLNSVYLGTSLSAQAYSIMPIGLLPSTLAQSVKFTLATANTALASTVRYDINSMGLSLTQQQNARTNIAALSALDVGAGRLSKSVAGGVDVTLTTVEASSQFIELTGTITANINVIVPAAARLFYILNVTSGAFTVTVKTPSGSGVAAIQNTRAMLECDGTSVVNPLTTLGGSNTIALQGATPSSGTGIAFPATQSASSDPNTLDDYEEGTWTPSIGGTATYTIQDGMYIKIGRLVYIQAKIQINVLGTGSTTLVSGLPFVNQIGSSSSAGGGVVEYFAGLPSAFLGLNAIPSNSQVSFAGQSAAAATMPGAMATVFQSGTRIDFTMVYQTTA